MPDWEEPDEDVIMTLTEDEQGECRTLCKNLSALSALPTLLKERNSSLSSLGDENKDILKPSASKPIIENHILQKPSGNLSQRRRGVLKTESNPSSRSDPFRRVTFILPESSENTSSLSERDLEVFPSKPYLETKHPSSNPSARLPTSPASSSSLSSMSSISPLLPSPAAKQQPDDSESSSSSSDEEEKFDIPEISPRSVDSEEAFLERTAVEISREVLLSERAYLGHRHHEDCVELASPPGRDPGKRKKHATQQAASHAAHQWSSQSVTWSALLHWAGVSRARRRERIAGRIRVRALVQRAASMPGVQQLPPGCANIRPGLFEPLGAPDLAVQKQDAGVVVDPAAYRDATLANLARLRPRLDLTLLAFSFNQDALRVYGGLVGKGALAEDLERMDGILRELEVYTAVCAHRRGLIVGHLKQTREFPIIIAAQFGDLRAAYDDSQEDKLAAARRCFEYVADRSRYVMTYDSKRRKRQFAGYFGRKDHEKLTRLSESADEAERLLEELAAAEEWQVWCKSMIGHWALGWRPDRFEKDMLYVDEVVEGDIRRYKRDINDKRAALGLASVERPKDAVYERQQEQIKLIDVLWKLLI
ncbi:hypothetical protein Daus18300_003505 [Diaporthe australafricana]|uniref:Uncharacterized protein n=1 Tax=Diaporthe australafricana TaxID=127596 RepID=A0ABR3XEX5_9PEZI